MDSSMLKYNALDSAVTLQCRDEFWPEVYSGGYGPAYDMTLRLYEPLQFMMTHGIKVNREAMLSTQRDIKEKEFALQAELDTLCGRHLNVASPKDCQKYFYVERNIPPYYSRPKPGVASHVTTDDLAMVRIARGTASRKGLREANLVQQIRGLRKLNGTYLEIEFDADGRLRCSYNPRGTKFGRLSSSATVFGTGTNLQNLPPEFKRFLVADTDHFLWEVDKRQAEWVVVAYLTGDSAMLRVIEQQLDPHTATAAEMFQVGEEVIRADHKLVGGTTDPETIAELRGASGLSIHTSLPRSMSGRQAGKKSNHGLNYDEGYGTFGLTNEIPESEAKRMVNLYHQIYPGIRIWYDAIKHQLGKDRTLTNCFGRKVHFMGAWQDDLFKSAYSYLPQSSVVDSLNQGMCDVYYSDDPDFKRLAILAQVHDSIMGQAHKSTLEDGSFHRAMQKVYRAVSPELEYGGRKFTIATDMKVGLNWGGVSKSNPEGMQEVHLSDNSEQFINTVRGHVDAANHTGGQQ